MKVSTKGSSSFLQKEDVAEPVVATIDCVTLNETLRNPYVLHFAPDDHLAPLPLNLVNRRVLVAAYGEEDENWFGKPVELYINPSVTNSQGAVVGGIRIRVPRCKLRADGAIQLPPAVETPTPSRPAPPVQKPEPLLNPHTAGLVAQAINGMNHSEEIGNLGEWLAWAQAIPDQSPAQAQAIDQAYQRHFTRLTPRPQAATAPIEEDASTIPF